jgi:hypothetical protein
MPNSNQISIDLSEIRKKREREAYARLALDAFDNLERADKREVLDRKAEVQIKGRERL